MDLGQDAGDDRSRTWRYMPEVPPALQYTYRTGLSDCQVHSSPRRVPEHLDSRPGRWPEGFSCSAQQDHGRAATTDRRLGRCRDRRVRESAEIFKRLACTRLTSELLDEYLEAVFPRSEAQERSGDMPPSEVACCKYSKRLLTCNWMVYAARSGLPTTRSPV